MNINEITTLIGSLGFPIFACCVMFWQNNKLQETLHNLSVTLEKMRTNMEEHEHND